MTKPYGAESWRASALDAALLDVCLRNAYFARVNRFLLALVAMLTGLSLSGTPAQARIAAGGGTEIGAQQHSGAILSYSVHKVAARFAAVAVTRDHVDPKPLVRPVYHAPFTASVGLKADRAHE